ncbi:MAG TPA: type II toxin-antitoxin system RelE/ParE family toxin [Phycisphaerales bacterium]
MRRLKIIIGPAAERDLLAIRDFIAEQAPDRALEYYDFLLDCVRDLGVFPKRYPREPAFARSGRDVRVRPVGAYRIIYAVRSSDVYVLRVRHGARRRTE